MKYISLKNCLIIFLLASCNATPEKQKAVTASTNDTTQLTTAIVAVKQTTASLEAMLAKKEVPVLCYHHIREAKPGQSESM